MARFSRLRRNTRQLLLATSFYGMSVGHAFDVPDSPAVEPIAITCKAVAVDAYISGFKTLLGELNTQKFDNQPLLTNGSTLAKAILKQNARQGKNILRDAPAPGGENASPPFSAVAMSGMIQVSPLEQWTAEIAATTASRQLMSAAAPLPMGQHTIGVDGLERIGIDFEVTPRLIIIEEEESLLGVAAEALETVIQPLLEPLLEEPGLLALNDAAPHENPPAETNLTEYVPHLPAGDDAPTENPELEASAALTVSPTMSPDEYLAAFQDRIVSQQEPHAPILPVAHHEMIQVSNSPALQALGGPINVTPCESETCRGFTIQFAPPAIESEARVFDGPAQIKLCDTMGTNSAVAEPAVHEEARHDQASGADALSKESLDQIAARLQQDFLARAMSGELDRPGAGAAGAKEAACPASSGASDAQTCTSTLCPPAPCPSTPCPPCGLAECPGCHGDSVCAAPALPALSAPPMHARSQWTLPTPAVTYNPYAQSAPIHGPGYGTVLPRDCDFYFRSPMEVPSGLPVGPAPATFAPQLACTPQPAYPPMSMPAATNHVPSVAASRFPITHESLDTHREISRTLDQLAERCEAQGMYDKADQLRDLARENRLSARAIHGQLATMPASVPYVVPTGYYTEPLPLPMMMPPANAVPPANAMPPQPLPIAQPIMVPRY